MPDPRPWTVEWVNPTYAVLSPDRFVLADCGSKADAERIVRLIHAARAVLPAIRDVLHQELPTDERLALRELEAAAEGIERRGR